jgi:hypothetical protein
LPLLLCACSAGAPGHPGDAGADLPPLPDLGTVAHVSSVGDPCATPSDCKNLPGAMCLTQPVGGGSFTFFFPNGSCAVPCLNGQGCPDDADCVNLPGQGLGVCLRRCDMSGQCRTGDGYCCMPNPFTANQAVCMAPADSTLCGP